MVETWYSSHTQSFDLQRQRKGKKVDSAGLEAVTCMENHFLTPILPH
jgi:hypothetical protein